MSELLRTVTAPPLLPEPPAPPRLTPAFTVVPEEDAAPCRLRVLPPAPPPPPTD